MIFAKHRFPLSRTTTKELQEMALRVPASQPFLVVAQVVLQVGPMWCLPAQVEVAFVDQATGSKIQLALDGGVDRRDSVIDVTEGQLPATGGAA